MQTCLEIASLGCRIRCEDCLANQIGGKQGRKFISFAHRPGKTIVELACIENTSLNERNGHRNIVFLLILAISEGWSSTSSSPKSNHILNSFIVRGDIS